MKLNFGKTLAALLIAMPVICLGQSAPAKDTPEPGSQSRTASAVSTSATEHVQDTFGVPTSDDFCRTDLRPEVVAFCPWLSELRRNVKNKQETRRTLNSLNPANPSAIGAFISAVAVGLATKTAVADALQAAGQARPDQQLGSTANTSGTSSAVEKAGSAELISLALDTGALTRSVNGSTSTLSANADHLFRLLTGHEAGCIINCKEDSFEIHVLNPTNITATFALAQSNSSIVPTTGQASISTSPGVTMAAIPTGAGKLSGISAKYQVLNKFDPRSASFKKLWAAQSASLGVYAIKDLNDTTAVNMILESDSDFLSSRTNPDLPTQLTEAARSDPSGKELVDAFETLWKKTELARSNPALPAAVAKVMQDRQIYRTAWYQAIAASAGTMLTLQYSFNKPVNQPQTHDLTLIYGYNFGKTGMITVNGATSFYSTIPVGAKYGRVHYGQVSGQYDRNLSNPTSSIQEQFSLAGYWQYQPSPSILNIAAGTVAPGTTIPLPNGTQEFVGTAGALWLTQAKITIKGTGGIQIPLGVSWSNKTDLLQGSKVGGQVGISYNFAKLAGLF